MFPVHTNNTSMLRLYRPMAPEDFRGLEVAP